MDHFYQLFINPIWTVKCTLNICWHTNWTFILKVKISTSNYLLLIVCVFSECESVCYLTSQCVRCVRAERSLAPPLLLSVRLLVRTSRYQRLFLWWSRPRGHMIDPSGAFLFQRHQFITQCSSRLWVGCVVCCWLFGLTQCISRCWSHNQTPSPGPPSLFFWAENCSQTTNLYCV